MAAKLFFGGCCAVQWWAAILLGSILSATDPVRPSPQAACLLTTFLLGCVAHADGGVLQTTCSGMRTASG